MIFVDDLPELITCEYSLDSDTYFVEGRPVCLRPVREGGHCEKDAGLGTHHAGKGPCYHHDRQSSGNIQTGQYSTVAKHQLRDQIRKFEESPYENLYAELAVLRALLARALQNFRGTRTDEDKIIKLVGNIQRLTDSINAINRDNVLTVMAAKYMLARAVSVAGKYITDPIELKAFVAEWHREVEMKPESPMMLVDNIEAGHMLLADDPKMVTDGFDRVVVEGSKLKK